MDAMIPTAGIKATVGRPDHQYRRINHTRRNNAAPFATEEPISTITVAIMRIRAPPRSGGGVILLAPGQTNRAVTRIA